MAGRPTKFTAEMRERVLSQLRAGNYHATAFRATGIKPATWKHWRNLANKLAADFPDNEYSAFFAQVQEAEYVCQCEAVAELRAAGKGDWRAALAYLERKWPQEWSRYRGELTEVKRQLNELKAALGLVPAGDDGQGGGGGSAPAQPLPVG